MLSMSITSRCVVLRHALARPEGPRGKRSRLARSILRRECKYIFSKFFSQSAQKQLQSLCGYAIITKILTRPCGQAVKTAPSHGAIPGSIPGKVTNTKTAPDFRCCFCVGALSERRTRRFARGVSAEAQPRGPLQGCRLIPCTGCAVCLLIFCVWRPCRAEEKRRRGRAACS